MTAVVALKNGDGVWMGADRAISNCWGNTATISTPKIFRNGPALIGFAGAPRPAQIVQYELEVPSLGDLDEFEWCVCYFIPALLEIFEYCGYRPDEEEYGLLVAVGGRLFTITADNAVIETDKKYAAIGDGEPYVLGVLSVVDTSDAEKAINLSLEAAENNCGSVLRPFDVMKLDG